MGAGAAAFGIADMLVKKFIKDEYKTEINLTLNDFKLNPKANTDAIGKHKKLYYASPYLLKEITKLYT